MRTRYLSLFLGMSMALASGLAFADVAPPPKVAFSCNDAGKLAYSGTCQANGPTPTYFCPPDPKVLYGCPANHSGVPAGQVEQVNEFDAGCVAKDGGGIVCFRGVEGTVDASCCQVHEYPSLCLDTPGCVSGWDGPKFFCSPTPSAACPAQEAGVADAGCDASNTCTPPALTPPASDSGGGCHLTTTNTTAGIGLLMFIALLWTLAFRRRD